MDSFKSTELEELLSTPVEQKESDRQLEHNTFREMLASGFQRDEEDITINFGRRTVLGYLENGDYRDEITSTKIDVVMNTLAEDAHPKLLTDRTPFIEIKASDEVLLRAEQNGGVTVNKFDISRLFNPSQTAAAQIEADSKLELDEVQYELDEIYQGTEQEIGGEFWEFDSTVLKFGLYEPDTSELTLEFQSGKNYTYRDISSDVWEDFKEAESAGQFYNQEIKGQYFVEKGGDNLLANRRIELDLDSDSDYITTEEFIAELETEFISPIKKIELDLDEVEAELKEFEKAYNSKNRDWQQYYESADIYEETITTEEFIAELETESTSPVRKTELDLDEVEAEIQATKSNSDARQQRLDDLASEALEKYHELDNTGDDTSLEADKSITVEIPFLEKGTEPQISHPLQEFDTSSLKDFLNQEYQLTDQLTKIYRVDAGDQIDYEALKGVVEKAVENLYPEWDDTEPNLADEIKWYRTNERSRELQVSTDLVLEEIDTEAQNYAKILNYLDQEDISIDVIQPLPPIQFQVTDTGGADSHFLDAVQQYIKDETDPRVLTENTGLSPAQVLVDEVVLIDPNISAHSQTQQWVYDTAQDINLDISQIRQDFTEQFEQQALVDEVAPQLVDILNELGTDNYQGKHRTIEFNNEQNELSLIENETGTVVMKAAWHPDEEKWENIGSSLTEDDRDHIQQVAQRLHQQQKDKETGLER
ncbi:MAG: KTSC domain-containing protein [Microcoleaceae cyanobacterium]